jgi:hypothetical protein
MLHLSKRKSYSDNRDHLNQGGEPRLADIRNRFGDRVADIVHACSDSVVNTAAGEQKHDWRTRKTRYIEHLQTVDRDVG